MVALPSLQLLLNGLVNGLVYGLLALAIVLVYRSNRVINFAVANIGLIGSTALPILVLRLDMPYWLALPIALAIGAGFGLLIELTIVRRLFDVPRVILLVATVGVAQLAAAMVTLLMSALADHQTEAYPVPWDGAWTPVDGLSISGAQLSVLIAVPVVALALTGVLGRSVLGKTVAASADNRDLARLHGISPKVVSSAVWAVAGLVGTVCLILISAQTASLAHVNALGPATLLRAMAAAVIAGMASYWGAQLAGILIGLVEVFIQFNWMNTPGLTDLVLFGIVLVAVLVMNAKGSAGSEVASFSFTSRMGAVPERLRQVWWIRNLHRFPPALLMLIALLVPLFVQQASRQQLFTLILAFAICALSVTILTGWAGQLSLGQMAFAGLGALQAAVLVQGWKLSFGDYVVELAPMPFLLAVVLSAVTMGVLAAVVGAGALRVRGLLLAISTFAFAIAAEASLYNLPIIRDTVGKRAALPRGSLFGLDLGNQRIYYYLLLGILVLLVAVAGRLRRSGIGRTTIAVRDNPVTAAAYTVNPTRVKLRSFVLAGGIAGLGGALLGGLLQYVPSDQYFLAEDSLTLVAVAVIGGLGSVIGPVLGALWIVGLPTLFPGSVVVPLLTSSVGLLALLLFLPGGFVQLGTRVRDQLLLAAERRRPAEAASAPQPTTAHALTATRRPVGAAASGPALRVTDIDVSFTGRKVVDAVSLDVAPGEIVGLIGTNGAGKTTVMNAIGGFVPATGTVELFGRDITGLRPDQRARAGLGRTFQAAALFPELTVSETVQVALEARGHTGLVSTALFLPQATSGERRKRAEAAEILGFLGLSSQADTPIADLSTGTRRMVELAGLLALDAQFLCLDEPTAGLGQRETELFGRLIVQIRQELGASMLVIEHDMPLIMSISDRIYCLEAGRVIAHGAPADVRNDPAVVASYLGGDQRAINRSDTQATNPPIEPALV